MSPLALLALAQIDGFAAQLTQFGVLGVVLAWFMFRTEARLKAIERTIDLLSNSILLKIISDEYINQATKERAKSLIAEIEQKHPKL